MWLPAERIAVEGRPVVVGYVLQIDPVYVTVLQAADSSVQIIALSQIESRSICRLNPSLESGSLIRYIVLTEDEWARLQGHAQPPSAA